LVSGGAPLNPEVGIFFDALGSCCCRAMGRPSGAGDQLQPAQGRRPMDTVGPPLKNTEVRSPRMARSGARRARHARILAQSDADRADGDRRLAPHGRRRHLDEAGRIVITDRKKDLIVNDKGDNVAPQKVEGMLTLQPEIIQAMVVGDKRPYVVGLIVPDPEWSAEWCAANGRKCRFTDMRTDPDYIKALSAAVDRVNADLSVIEKVRRFVVADEPFTVENQQLTPSIKIRRHVLKEVYGPRLDALYAR
jgi:long-chain acyl-CoA synthetase